MLPQVYFVFHTQMANATNANTAKIINVVFMG